MTEAAPRERRRGGRAWVTPVVALALAALVWWFVTRLVGAVDWSAVGAALGRLDLWMAAPLGLALLLRQLLNSVPLMTTVPGLGLRRSMENDLTANLVATVMPPPADIVVRVGMFTSWGLDPVLGMAGVTLNSVKFYAVRFLAPVLGLVLLAAEGLETRQWLTALACGLVASALLTGLALLLRGDHLAAWLGRTVGRVARRVRSSVDPEAWSRKVVEIRGSTAESLRTGLLPSMVALLGMVLADGLVILLALRFVGVDSGLLGTELVLGVFLLAYPLTILPMFGFGVMDAVLLGWWVAEAGTAAEPGVVAGTIVWRVVTILGTLLLGVGALGLWRLHTRRTGAVPSDRPVPSDPPVRSDPPPSAH